MSPGGYFPDVGRGDVFVGPVPFGTFERPRLSDLLRRRRSSSVLAALSASAASLHSSVHHSAGEGQGRAFPFHGGLTCFIKGHIDGVHTRVDHVRCDEWRKGGEGEF